MTIDPSGRAATSDAAIRTYADHRMATMGAVLALRIPGLRVADPATTTKTMPDFVATWETMLRRAAGTSTRDDVRVRPSGRTAGAARSGRLPEGTSRHGDRGGPGRFTLSRARSHGDSRARPAPGAQGSLVVDRVGIDGPPAGIRRTLWSASSREPRRTELVADRRRHRSHRTGHRRQRRSDGDRDVRGDPEPSFGFIDRCLVAAYDAGSTCRWCSPKAIWAPRMRSGNAIRAGFPSHSHAPPARPTLVFDGPLVESLAGVTSAILVGQSGVGKSTLVNARVPGGRIGRWVW